PSPWPLLGKGTLSKLRRVHPTLAEIASLASSPSARRSTGFSATARSYCTYRVRSRSAVSCDSPIVKRWLVVVVKSSTWRAARAPVRQRQPSACRGAPQSVDSSWSLRSYCSLLLTRQPRPGTRRLECSADRRGPLSVLPPTPRVSFCFRFSRTCTTTGAAA